MLKSKNNITSNVDHVLFDFVLVFAGKSVSFWIY